MSMNLRKRSNGGDVSCPNCGSETHIHCTTKRDVEAIERKVAHGRHPLVAALEHVSEKTWFPKAQLFVCDECLAGNHDEHDDCDDDFCQCPNPIHAYDYDLDYLTEEHG